MSIDDSDEDFHSELVDVLIDLVRIASRVRVLEARDNPQLTTLLTRAHAVLERLTDVEDLSEDIRIQ
jgi:hypothetical protein